MLNRQKIIGTIGYMGGVMSVPEPFCWSWGNMLVFAHEAVCRPGEHILPVRAKVSLHDFARNDLLRQMQGDWILMLDTDIAFEPDLAARMIGTFLRHRLDVLTGMYSYKTPPHYPVAYLRNPEGRQETLADWPKDEELIPIDSAGAGVLIVRRQVFERIVAELRESPFDRIGTKGEDHSFFDRLRRLDIKAWLAPRIEIQHLHYLGVQTSEHFRPDREPDHFFERESSIT